MQKRHIPKEKHTENDYKIQQKKSIKLIKFNTNNFRMVSAMGPLAFQPNNNKTR